MLRMISARLVVKAVVVEYKTCTKCGTEHPTSYFWKQSKAKDGLNTWCKSCITDGMREGARKRKREAIELLGGKCQRCSGVFHPAVYDFHHKDPTEKETSIAILLQSYAVDHYKVQQELEKCILLCSNCHRVVHTYEENIDRACKSGVCGI